MMLTGGRRFLRWGRLVRILLGPMPVQGAHRAVAARQFRGMERGGPERAPKQKSGEQADTSSRTISRNIGNMA